MELHIVSVISLLELLITSQRWACLSSIFRFTERPFTFATILDFSEKFQADLEEQNKQTIVTALHWVLKDQPRHKKRIYLAQYLLKIEVPDDVLNQDEYLPPLYNEYLATMDEFKQAHREHAAATDGLEDPAPLEEQLQRMNEEVETLENQKDEARRKIQHIVCYYLLVSTHIFFLSSLSILIGQV